MDTLFLYTLIKQTALAMFFAFSFVLAIGTEAHTTSHEKFLVGACTHYAQGKGDVNNDLASLKGIGIRSIRDEYYWNRVEPSYGMFKPPPIFGRYLNAAINSDLRPLIVLGYGNKLYENGRKPSTDESISAFSKYCGEVAEKYAGRVYGYEIWNEWAGRAGGLEPGDAESYLKLARPCSTAIRASDPAAQILVGSVTSKGMTNGWLEELIKLKGSIDSDGISVHPYVHCDRKATPETWYRRLVRALTQAGIALTPESESIYITEMGWPMNEGKCGRSPETVAAYNARTTLLARTIPNIKGLWLYEARDRGLDHHDFRNHFGLLDVNGRHKESIGALPPIFHLVQSYQLGGIKKVDPNAWALEFSGPDGEKGLVAWKDGAEIKCHTLPWNGHEAAIHFSQFPTIYTAAELANTPSACSNDL